MTRLRNGENRGNRLENIIQHIILAIRLTFIGIMFVVLSHMPIAELTQYSLQMGYVSEQVQIPLLMANEKKTAVTLVDTLNATEQSVSMELGDVLDKEYISYTKYIEYKNYILSKNERYYKFNGYWSQEPNANTIDGHCGEQYIDENGKCIKEYWEDEVLTLYAHWAIVCKVNFYTKDTNGMYTKIAFTKYPYVGKTFLESDEWITDDDKKSANVSQMLWFKDVDTTTQVNQYYEAPDQKNMKLYGKVVPESERVTYTVTLLIEDGVEIDLDEKSAQKWKQVNNTYVQEYPDQINGGTCGIGTLPTPQRTGYTCNSWIDINSNTLLYDDSQITKSIVCRPLWTAKQYPVKLMVEGEDDKEITLVYGEIYVETVGIPANKDHYTFDGYYSDDDEQYFDSEGNNVKQWDIDQERATLTAKYIPIEYTITYELDGGAQSEANPVHYNIENDTITLATPTKEGYEFVGWQTPTNSAPQMTITIPQGSYGNRTYIAVFALIEQEKLTITVECANFTDQSIIILLYDESNEFVASITMGKSSYTFAPNTNSGKYYIMIKCPIPNKITFDALPNDCVQTTLASTTKLTLTTATEQNYTISFSATDAQIINTITI